MMEVNQRLIYYTGGYDKQSQDGIFTTVTSITKTGRFRITADNEKHLYYPDSMQRIQKRQKWSSNPYCRLINEDNKALENKAFRRLWIDRIASVDLEKASTELLIAMIGTLNTHKE